MNKKTLRFLCTTLMAVVCMSANAQATSGTCGDQATWAYDASETTLTISGTGAMADYTDDPSSTPWADYRTSITKVVIGDGITAIGNCAFNLFTALTDVTIGESVETIGIFAFDNCTAEGFTKLNIPNSVKIIKGCAFSNNHLKYICLGSGVKEIWREAFMVCQDLEYIGCYALTPPTLYQDAFNGVTNLKAIYVDNYCRSNYTTADGWSDFADIIQTPYGNCGDGEGDEPSSNVRWSIDMMTRSLNLSSSTGGAIKQYNPTDYPWNNPALNPMGGEYNMYWTGIQTITVGKNITNIPDWAFAMQTNCRSITLPSTITSIGSSALEECAFTSITLPEGLKTIGDYAFYGSKLTSLLIPSTVTTIGSDAFLDNNDLAIVTCAGTSPATLANPVFGDGSKLNAIYVPAGTTVAYKDAWANYESKIQEVPTTTFTYTASEQVTKFDTYANFNGALSVKSHDFADGAGTVVYEGYVTAIGQSALTYTKLTSITIPESVTVFDTYSFQGSNKLETVTLAGTSALTTIGARAFNSCSALTAFTVPATVTSIGASAFASCSNLTTFTFDGTPTITSIGNSAFQDCMKLTAFTIPESVTTLGTTVFWYAGLTSLNIPAGVTSIGQALYCSSPVTSLTVDAGNAKYADLGCNGIFEKTANKLVAGGAATTIPNGITTIGEEAFWGEEGEFTLTLPESVTTIESRAFHMARGLTSLTIPSGVTHIDEECFLFCEGMQDVYCYADVNALTWDGGMQWAFNMMNEKSTKFHVAEESLETWTAKFPDANVTFVGDLGAKAAGSISYASSTVTKYCDDEPFTIPLTLKGDGTASYTSSNPAVATVDAGSGLVTIVGKGWTEITATVADGEEYAYNPNKASYILTILEIGDVTGLPKIIVWFQDGTTQEIPFDNSPEFEYNAATGMLSITGTDYSWPLADLVKFTFMPYSADRSIIDYALTGRWNWISTNLKSEVKRGATMFLSSISSDVERLVSQTQEIINDPVYGMVGNLKQLDVSQGYKLLLKEGAAPTLKQEGGPADLATKVQLKQGWNWIGFIPTQPMLIADALMNLQPTAGDRIQALGDAFAEYGDNGWEGTLHKLTPGMGYLYHRSGNDTQFTYPATSDILAARAVKPRHSSPITSHVSLDSPWQYDAHQYPDVTTIIACLYMGNQAVDLEGYSIGAFCDGECRGVGKVVGDKVFITIHGIASEGEAIEFRAYEHDSGQTLPVDETIVFQGQCLGSLPTPMPLHTQSVVSVIADTQQPQGSKRIYTTDGKRLEQPQKGVNIVVDADGTVKKTIVSKK